MNSKKKYLFLYLKTGGGHLAPAKAVAQHIRNNNKGVEIVLADAFEESGWLVKFVIEEGYRFLQRKAKWFYELTYAVNKISIVSELSAHLVSRRVEKILYNLIVKNKPDKIVIFHFFLIKPVYRILKKYNIDTPTVTVVTDPYIAHPLWFLNSEQNFIVFSRQLKEHCIKKGIDEKRINVFPFILDEKFSKTASAEEVEEFKKKFTAGKKVLLVLGGGDGIPKGLKLLENILRRKIDCSIIVVCGKNKKLFEQAEKLRINKKAENLKVFGYVDFVYELLSISDVVITKCGASTFMEILISNKIPIVNSYIWEQEKGNVDFIVDNELGIYETNIKKMIDIVNRLFSEPDMIAKYKNNISALKLENGTKKVAAFISNEK